jgi:NADP-dependent 3-hydroxy acid dehydrogenase YdfG
MNEVFGVMKEFKYKVALLTGAGNSFGKGFAKKPIDEE